jgi:membrane protease YdiL (CAAX protease family)
MECMATDQFSAPFVTPPRVTPKVRWGLIAYFAYLLVFFGSWIAAGIDYEHIADDEGTLLRWYVLPLAAGAVAITVVITVYGWWKPVLFERTRLRRWPAILPGVLLAAFAVIAVATAANPQITPLMWVLLVTGSLLVGFNEEIVTRGVLVVALRSRFGEIGVWLLSATLFALIHLPNAFFGIGAEAVVQVFFAFGFGSVAYLLRRGSGAIFWTMGLHALWDFASFSTNSFLLIMQPFVGGLAIILAIVLLWRESAERRANLATV